MKRLKGGISTGQEADAQRAGEATISPLRKCSLNGELYERDPKVEVLLSELAILSRDELIARAAITKRSDPRYIPSECLVYFIRASRYDTGEVWFERLYRVLNERVLRSLPKAENPDGKTESLARGAVRDKASGRFVELLAADRAAYDDRLDYFEIRFDGALAKLRLDAQRQDWRDEKRRQPLEYDEVSGELSAAVEAAARAYDPFTTPDFDDEDYRLRLDAAIDTLPTEQRTIIHMLGQGFPIDSKEPDVMTIAKALGRSEKTIRTHRDKAFAALRSAMGEGEKR